jgi:hypothetical protein
MWHSYEMVFRLKPTRENRIYDEARLEVIHIARIGEVPYFKNTPSWSVKKRGRMLPTQLEKSDLLLPRWQFKKIARLSLKCLRVLCGLIVFGAALYVAGCAIVQAPWLAMVLETSSRIAGPLGPLALGGLIFVGLMQGISLIIGEQV